MRLLSTIVALTALVAKNDAFSIPDNKILSQKEAIRMSTRRETIKMPTQTPMVPWTVRYKTVSAHRRAYGAVLTLTVLPSSCSFIINSLQVERWPNL
jgi:hypothetical protein